ncbi:MAG TPA: aminopeptidase [Gaiellaceae bacterium]|nr:aminopeptidase [Gaiellaceae bacterium]
MDTRFDALGELAVHGANVQPGQILGVTAAVGQEELARAVASAGYRRGAIFVDVTYFDPFVKRERILHADPDTLSFVPDWAPARLLGLAARRDARVSLGGVVAPGVFDGLDSELLGRDQLPWLKESANVIDDRSTNWSIVPCPHPEWASLVYPGLERDAAYERLWEELWHVLRLDEPDPRAAWDARVGVLHASAEALNAKGFDALHLRGPGTDLEIGLLPTSHWRAGDFETVGGIRHLPNLPTEEVFTAPDPDRVEGHVTSTRPLVLKDGTIIRRLHVRFEGGRAVEIEGDENAGALRSHTSVDEGAARIGELALVDREGRIGPLETIFYDTLLDENAASHIALGNAYAFSVGEEDRGRLNKSTIHIDFMIGSLELEVTGVTPAGDRIPVLRDGAWQL